MFLVREVQDQLLKMLEVEDEEFETPVAATRETVALWHHPQVKLKTMTHCRISKNSLKIKTLGGQPPFFCHGYI